MTLHHVMAKPKKLRMHISAPYGGHTAPYFLHINYPHPLDPENHLNLPLLGTFLALSQFLAHSLHSFF